MSYGRKKADVIDVFGGVSSSVRNSAIQEVNEAKTRKRMFPVLQEADGVCKLP